MQIKYRGTPPKTKRNKRLVELKQKGITFRELAKVFDLSEARTKDIYYREIKRTKETSREG